MKKIPLFLLVIVVMFGLMTGCGDVSEDSPVIPEENGHLTESTNESDRYEVEEDGTMDVNDAEFSSEIDASEYEKYKSESTNTINTSANTSNGSGSSNAASGQNPSSENPAPVDWQNTEIDTGTQLTCTFLIDCSTILDNMDNFNQAKFDLVPSDGVIYAKKTVVFYEGESVSDVLIRETRNNRIHMEYNMTPLYNSNYIEGIGNIYEFDCGNLSGWMYNVNGWYPNYGCSRYLLEDGDAIEWRYTCDLGRDLGTYWEK